ncbi:MAG: alkane 1-monooxygenase [Chryseotalea sp.]|jgi:alkane 1-monooxygenase|nr:alkane 1-monooxygenase [Flammeovirgaceae bacterium]
MALLKRLGFFTAFILPALVVAGVYLNGYWQMSTIVFVFIFIPFADYLIGLDTSNVKKEVIALETERYFYRLVTYVWMYLQLAFLFWCVWVITQEEIHGAFEWFCFILSTGLVTGGIGITVAHELGHKKPKIERFYSQVLLMTVCYMHFYIEHNRGHHVYVATPEDPATAQKNETFYRFWFKSVFVGYKHAWHLENVRLIQKNKSFFSIDNKMIHYQVLPALFCLALLVFGYLLSGEILLSIPLFFFSQSIVAFTLLELVNYLEHYGIQRKKLPSGRYEQVNPLHSWNASHLISNFFLFQLQRHSDHHAYAHKRYQVLEHYDESPQLPYGYPTMILIALVPPLWFNLMNKKLDEWQMQSIT